MNHHNQIKNIIASIDMFGESLPKEVMVSALTAGREPIKNAVGKAKYNSKGQLLNRNTLLNATVNDFGYDIAITTLTQVRQEIVEQVFYEVAPAEYMPVDVGTGAWMQELLTYATYATGDDFESGNLKVGSESKLPRVGAGITPITTPIVNWAKELEYSLMDINQAAKSGNWSLIQSLERARKMNWDLGIQKIAFLGSTGNTNIKGLLNLAGVNSNTSLITGPISSMNSTNFAALVAGLLGAYSTNSSKTALPDTFVIPLADYLGLAAPTNEDFTIVSKLDYLLTAFRKFIPNFKILGLAYGNADSNNLGLTRYALYKSTPDCLSMFIPVNYTTALVGSLNNFQFQGVGYGQYSGVQVFRPKTVLYLDY
jgi:hypothetical protein